MYLRIFPIVALLLCSIAPTFATDGTGTDDQLPAQNSTAESQASWARNTPDAAAEPVVPPAQATAPDPNAAPGDTDAKQPTASAPEGVVTPGDTGTELVNGQRQPAGNGKAGDNKELPATTQGPISTSPASKQAAPNQQVMDMTQVIALLQQQQQELVEQRKLLAAQSAEMDRLKQELDVLRAPPPAPAFSEEAVTRSGAGEAGDTTAPDMIAGAVTADEQAQAQKDAVQEVARAQADDPTEALLEEFTGAWRLPGTSAALGIGGFVKSTVVYNFDPLEIRDRFIVGSIPVDDSFDIEAQSSITASQSRLNFDLREPTNFGILRAFIEGDFAGDGDTFRLRHAFGQWKDVLAGKTWSAFVDTTASPEEVDFEGLNGRINVRQSQVRFRPSIGQNYQLQFSLEDPNPQIQNGQGVTRAPDLVATGRFSPHERLHLKVALLGRQIRGQRDPELGGGVEKEYAWGSTLSGRFMTPAFDARDNLMFQLNIGDGIGRYVNDLSSVGNFDGIFDTESGDLELFDIVSGYLSWQHWWHGQVRSNFTFGFVDVDNPGFVEGDAYKQTLRASTNILWMPTPRIDLGVEYLWGKRENEDGQNDDATQFQLAARYRF